MIRYPYSMYARRAFRQPLLREDLITVSDPGIDAASITGEREIVYRDATRGPLEFQAGPAEQQGAMDQARRSRLLHRYIEEIPGEYGPREVRFVLQNGPVSEVGVNGATIDLVIAWCRSVLEKIYREHPSRSLEIAITKLDEANLWLESRQAELGKHAEVAE